MKNKLFIEIFFSNFTAKFSECSRFRVTATSRRARMHRAIMHALRLMATLCADIVAHRARGRSCERDINSVCLYIQSTDVRHCLVEIAQTFDYGFRSTQRYIVYSIDFPHCSQ